MPSIELNVRNMSCGSCVTSVTRALRGVEGVAGVDVDLRSGRVLVQATDAAASRPGFTAALVAALGAAGYPAVPAAQARPAPTNAASSGCCGSAQADGQGRAASKGCCGP